MIVYVCETHWTYKQLTRPAPIQTSTIKSKGGRKRRRVQQSTDQNDEGGDADDSHFEAAQSQLLEEMVAAGLAADSLPMSFGSKKQQQNGLINGSNSRKNKRKRAVDDADEEECAHGDRSYRSAANTITITPNPSAVLIKLEKVHVKYDSDGEVAERVVEAVEQLASEPAADDEETSAPVDEPHNSEYTESTTSEAAAVVQLVNPAPGTLKTWSSFDAAWSLLY